MRRLSSRLVRIALVLVVVGVPAALVAAVSLPHTFADGQVASAAQVNANFTTLAGAVNGHEGRLATLEGAAAVTCSGPGVTQTAGRCVFAYSGSKQKLMVPAGTTLTVKAWGAAGGPPGTSKVSGYTSGRGGHGGFVQGTFAVPEATTYRVIVGQGGGTEGDMTFGWGGPASYAYVTAAEAGGAGGGLTGLFADVVVQQAALIVAGGGGGAGGSYTQTGGDANTGNTLRGGTGAGYAGDFGGVGGSLELGPGAGGAPGRCGGGGLAGGPLHGGGGQNSCNYAGAGGGGGGGGHWGGGGAGGYYAAGGAGSSFLDPSATATLIRTGPYSTDPAYPGAPVAVGSTTAVGGNGHLVVTW